MLFLSDNIVVTIFLTDQVYFNLLNYSLEKTNQRTLTLLVNHTAQVPQSFFQSCEYDSKIQEESNINELQ